MTWNAKEQGEWARLAVDGWMLGMEAGAVMWLRTVRLMAGGASADREARAMVDEKVLASVEAVTRMMFRPVTTAAAMRHAMTPYASRVSANRKRLGRG